MEGHLKQRGKSKTWYLVYDLPKKGPKRRQKWVPLGTKSKALAQTKRRQILTELENPSTPETRSPTVAAFFQEWLLRRKASLAAKTHERYESLLRLHVTPLLGDVLMTDVAPKDIEDVYASMREFGLSGRTCLHVHRCLHAAFEYAKRTCRLVTENVVDSVDTPKAKNRENDVLSEADIRMAMEATRGSRLELPVMFAALTGLRRGEVLAERWRNVDLERGQIMVTEALEQTRSHGVRFKEPKSRSSRRLLPIPEVLVERLRSHKTVQDQERETVGPGWLENDLVFCNPDGAPWPPDTLTKQFAEAMRFAGIEGVRLHDLRHAFASITLRNGVSVKEVSALLGHSSPLLTLSTYARQMEGQGREAVNGLAASLLPNVGG